MNMQQMRFLHEGAPPNFSAYVQDFLSANFLEWSIGFHGLPIWPPQSPDLNPAVFFQ